ncbi:dolichol-phosphate mannose synthase subunit 3-like isoform X2 [Vigna angularis]|uniref:dolichol-phosphate mannose synthase subunit 3-like isoform X2 n=1 Tax=Phaseolus angularis TaxID=3914 RepID=UPI0022B31220|nr:dolichol-phosphate mannose synthase subunit 3-like isoform X2 [Vigna angularis]
MKHIVKILALVVAITVLWIGLLQTSVIPYNHTWLLPIYFVVSLGCYGLLMVGVGLMNFPTCPQEALLLQKVQNLEWLWDRWRDTYVNQI